MVCLSQCLNDSGFFSWTISHALVSVLTVKVWQANHRIQRGQLAGRYVAHDGLETSVGLVHEWPSSRNTGDGGGGGGKDGGPHLEGFVLPFYFLLFRVYCKSLR
jgi:hypothetical protein